ncbi:MAG: formate--tetrahydrofolate ligase [Myxococcales bacterium]|nr:formate--tetrahydrofolate ligase [Myxococcales bacterium]
MQAIEDVAKELGLSPEDLLPMGRGKAKVDLGALNRAPRARGKLILVSAVTPTKSGEGKTTMSISLAMGLRKLERRAVVCLREPSLGPVFGMKGGGTGGGKAQIVPAADINLHFNGDLHAITAAHNLLAAMVDNDLHFGGKSGLDARRITWPRVMDMNDRALRQVLIGLGGQNGGVPRESRFDITAASEVMAVLALSEGPEDLRARLGRLVVGYAAKRRAVTADDLGAAEAMAALLRDALMPNLVQTQEGGPALVHGGPFANIAHGCSSVLATRMGMRYADYVVTEAGFGFDLGGEKFLDIKCRQAGLWPRCVVLVATIKALQSHGRGNLEEGLAHLDRQKESIGGFGLRPVVAINAFPDDSPEDLAKVEAHCAKLGLRVAACTGFAEGGEGSRALAEQVLEEIEASDASPPEPRHPYPLEASYPDKLRAVARAVYGAEDVAFTGPALKTLQRFDQDHPGLPVCVAKTHLSFSDDPAGGGLAKGFVPTVRSARAYLGAGFVTALMGDIMTMPGLPREPAARRVKIEPNGRIRGLMQND